MSIADAIIEFEKQLHSAVVILASGFGSRPGENDRIYQKRKELAEIALHALRAQQEAEKNEPLMLDELRKMVNKPVYLRHVDPLLDDGWHIIKAVTKDKIIFRGWNFVYAGIDGLGVDYNLYRQEPEEDVP